MDRREEGPGSWVGHAGGGLKFSAILMTRHKVEKARTIAHQLQ